MAQYNPLALLYAFLKLLEFLLIKKQFFFMYKSKNITVYLISNRSGPVLPCGPLLYAFLNLVEFGVMVKQNSIIYFYKSKDLVFVLQE